MSPSPRSAPASARALDPVPARAWLPAAGIFGVLVAYLLVRDIGVPAYDDAYFFKRFALHALQHGRFAWNLEDGPVYGCTSQAFQLLATLCAAVSHTHYVAVIKLVSAASLVGLALGLGRWCARASASGGARPERGPMIMLLGLGSPLVLTTVLTGMETATTLLALAAVLVAMIRPEGGLRVGPIAAAGLTVAIYLFRPDVAVVPAVAYGLHAVARRELPWRYLAALAPMMLGLLGILWAYYGTPLPLSFFMKTAGLNPYGEHVVALGLQAKVHYFAATLGFAAPLVWIAAHRRDATTLALLGATAALWGYHLLLTNEIMGYRGRFYVPGTIPLIMAAARSDLAFRTRGRRPAALATLVLAAAVIAGYLLAILPTEHSEPLARIPWPSYAGLVAGAAWVLLPPARPRPWLELGVLGVLLSAAVLGWKHPVSFRLRSDAALMRIHARQVTTVRGLFDVARCLPHAANVYHSELGVTGLVLSRTRVVDLVGILSDHALRGEPFERYCARDRPEAIFLPHRSYRELNAEIERSPCFGSYRRVVQRSSSPLHIREDLADAFLGCATEVQRWGAPEPDPP